MKQMFFFLLWFRLFTIRLVSGMKDEIRRGFFQWREMGVQEEE